MPETKHIDKEKKRQRREKTSKYFKIALAFKVNNLDAMEIKPEGKIITSKFNSLKPIQSKTFYFHSYDEAINMISSVLADYNLVFVSKKITETRVDTKEIAEKVNKSVSESIEGMADARN